MNSSEEKLSDENGVPHQKQINLLDLIEPSWFSGAPGESLWISGYRMIRVDRGALADGIKIIKMGFVHIVIINGMPNYFDTSSVEFDFSADDQIRVSVSPQHKTAPDGMYLLILTPYATGGADGNEPLTRDMIKSVVGLLATLGGRNIVYKWIYDNIVEISNGKTSGFSPVFENPGWFPIVDLSAERLLIFEKAGEAIQNLSNDDRNRVNLSLRWFESAFTDDGVDSFLKFWFSIETLSMPNTSNIRSANVIISKAYGISYQDACDTFGIGLVFGFRSRIVHGGKIVPIHAHLIQYMEALYSDVLYFELGLKCEQRAKLVLSRPDFNLSNYLH